MLVIHHVKIFSLKRVSTENVPILEGFIMLRLYAMNTNQSIQMGLTSQCKRKKQGKNWKSYDRKSIKLKVLSQFVRRNIGRRDCRSSHLEVFLKKVFWKYAANLQDNTHAEGVFVFLDPWPLSSALGPRPQNIARLNTILLFNFEVVIKLKL